jgi:hypothetical protein
MRHHLLATHQDPRIVLGLLRISTTLIVPVQEHFSIQAPVTRQTPSEKDG